MLLHPQEIPPVPEETRCVGFGEGEAQLLATLAVLLQHDHVSDGFLTAIVGAHDELDFALYGELLRLGWWVGNLGYSTGVSDSSPAFPCSPTTTLPNASHPTPPRLARMTSLDRTTPASRSVACGAPRWRLCRLQSSGDQGPHRNPLTPPVC